MTPDTPLEVGRAALKAGDAAAALAAFDAAVIADPESAEAHDGRAMAAWWVDQTETVFTSRESAYRLFMAQGDKRSAARLAVWMAWDHDAFRGEIAVAGGWLARARELLEGQHDTVEYAWLSVRESAFALLDHNDPTSALTCADAAIAAARASRSVGFELVGRSLRGFALATSGHVAEGMRELDTVAAAVLGGEVRDRLAIGMACCYLIAACDRVRDYERAVQWCKRLKAYCAQWHFLTLFAVCRTQYAAVCMWRGAWSEAEEELENATRELSAVRPGMVSEALVRMGELRRRQGRADEALALFDRAGGHPLAMIGRATLAADRGDWQRAAELADRYLRQLPTHNRTERASALELLVRAAVARGVPEQAIAPLALLDAIAIAAATRPLQALASVARGVAAAGRGDDDEARRCFEDAVDLYTATGATFERARAVLDLADALRRLNRHDDAAREAASAASLLAGLAVSVEYARPDRIAPSHMAVVPPVRSPNGGLTAREVDVLRLIAAGQGNPTIATSLGISEHTVHRHVANTLTKLAVTSRAAAVAQAARLGVL